MSTILSNCELIDVCVYCHIPLQLFVCTATYQYNCFSVLPHTNAIVCLYCHIPVQLIVCTATYQYNCLCVLPYTITIVCVYCHIPLQLFVYCHTPLQLLVCTATHHYNCLCVLPHTITIVSVYCHTPLQLLVCTATHHYNCLHNLNVFYAILHLIFVFHNVQFNFLVDSVLKLTERDRKQINIFERKCIEEF